MTGNFATSLRVSYSTATAESVGDFLATRYALPSPVECSLLRRGFNDSFEVLDANGQRYVLRLSCRRMRGEADVASETEFLTYLDRVGVPVAAPVPAQDGALFTCGLLPEGRRPVVLFRHIGGRSPKPGASTDARAQGVTLARIHAAAENYAGAKVAHYRLDLDHLLHRPVAAVMGIKALATKTREYLRELASRLSASVAAAGNLSWTLCHGDCHGGNARIAEDGPHAGQAIFFDFDDGGPGYLAYDLAVYLWANAFLQRERVAMWHAFIDGYRSIRSITATDFDALHLFVPIRHIWLMGEYAGRIAEWGSEAVPVEWLAKQADLLQAWEDEKLSPDCCKSLPGKFVGRATGTLLVLSDCRDAPAIKGQRPGDYAYARSTFRSFRWPRRRVESLNKEPRRSATLENAQMIWALGSGFYKDHPDYSVFCREWCIGRIYENRSGPEDQRRFWALNAPGGRERRSSRRAGSNGKAWAKMEEVP